MKKFLLITAWIKDRFVTFGVYAIQLEKPCICADGLYAVNPDGRCAGCGRGKMTDKET